MMKILQMIALSFCLVWAGTACSNNSGTPTASSSYNSSLRTKNPYLTPDQKKTIQNLRFIQRGFFLEYQRRKLSERDVLDVRNDDQFQTIENLRWLYQYTEGQRLQRKARLRIGSGVL